MSTAPQRLGKYEFLQFLGKGNVGEVWLARDLSNKHEVALKTVFADLQRSDPQFLTRFMTDGQVLVSLRHPNLVPTLEVNITRQEQTQEITAYLTQEYVQGQTLATYLQQTSHRGNFLPLSEIIYLFTSLGLALDYAQQREITHGNLTPGNILLNQHNTSNFPAGEPMLADTGLTQIVATATNTRTKAPLYLAPEQAQGYPPSQRGDVYSLGVILYEICTGTVPFRGETAVSIMSQHIRTLPTPPALINPHISPALSEIILRAIAKDPLTRFPKASALAAAITESSNAAPTSSKSSGPLAGNDWGKSQATILSRNSFLGVAQPLYQPVKSIPISKYTIELRAPWRTGPDYPPWHTRITTCPTNTTSCSPGNRNTRSTCFSTGCTTNTCATYLSAQRTADTCACSLKYQ